MCDPMRQLLLILAVFTFAGCPVARQAPDAPDTGKAPAAIPTVTDKDVTVTPRVTKLTRKGDDIPEDSKIVEVRTPVISGINDPDLLKKVQDAVNYEKVFDFTITEEELDGGLGDIFGVDYTLNHVDDSILSIRLTASWYGMVEEDVAEVVVDLTTGDRLFVRDVFTDLKGLAAVIAKAQRKEIDEKAKELAKEDPDLPSILEDQLSGVTLSSEDLREFSVFDDGVAFIYKYEFSRPAYSLQPEGIYKFTWNEISRFIKENGALAKFRVAS